MGCKTGEIEFAKREACHRFDEWVDVTGFVARHTGYYYELLACIEESVDIAFAVAFEQPLPCGEVDEQPPTAAARNTADTVE